MLHPEVKKSTVEIEDGYLAEFCEKIGMRHFFGFGHLWQSMGLRLFVPIPNCFPVSLSQDDLDFMWGEGAFFIHHAVPDNENGFPGYVFLIDDKSYDLDCIRSSDRRHNIRRAFKYCTVDQVSFELLKSEAPRLISDTYLRQCRNCGASVLEGWKTYMDAAGSNPLFSAWGTFVGKELAAAKIEFRYRGGVHPEALFSRTDLLKYYTMNALLFVSTRETIRKDDVTYISHGMRPVTGEKESLAGFKESMGFRKLTVNERLEVNPVIKRFLGRYCCKASSWIPERFCENSEYVRLVQGILSTLNRQAECCGT